MHRTKRPEDRNATAVVDRTIQTLIEGPGRRGGQRRRQVGRRRTATEANARPHEAVRAGAGRPGDQTDDALQGAPRQRSKIPAQQGIDRGQAEAPPTHARRSFEPSYGAAKELAGFDSMTVRATDGTETLLKHALAVPAADTARGAAGSAPAARLRLNVFSKESMEWELKSLVAAVAESPFEQNVVKLLDAWSAGWQHRGRVRAIGHGAYDKYCALGLYGHGGIVGVSRTSDDEEVCRVVNGFLQEQDGGASEHPKHDRAPESCHHFGELRRRSSLGGRWGRRVTCSSDDQKQASTP